MVGTETELAALVVVPEPQVKLVGKFEYRVECRLG
jgi:hypothetical protein